MPPPLARRLAAASLAALLALLPGAPGPDGQGPPAPPPPGQAPPAAPAATRTLAPPPAPAATRALAPLPAPAASRALAPFPVPAASRALAPPQPPPPAPVVGGRVPALRLPVAGPVVRGFEAPAGPYGPGHRGVDLGAPAGTAVAAPAAGRVSFAGPVAGSLWVSLLVAPGVVLAVGPLLDTAVATGEGVQAGARVGRLAAGHGGAVHLSLRVDGGYVDPLPWLVDRPRPRLVPLPATA
jgi:murein DD-endopeptidase MepM/ murein hydrolase activator NlpD